MKCQWFFSKSLKKIVSLNRKLKLKYFFGTMIPLLIPLTRGKWKKNFMAFIRLMVQWRENFGTMANTSLSWLPEASRPRNRWVNNICFTMTEQLWLLWLHISYFLCSFASLCYFLCHQINRMNNFLRRLSTPWAALGSLVKLGFTLSFVHKRYSLGKISSQKTMAKAMDCL